MVGQPGRSSTPAARAARFVTVGIAVAVALACPLRCAAHDAIPPLTGWGDFGASVPCLRALAEAARQCAGTAIDVRRACLDAGLSGRACAAGDAQAAVEAARQRSAAAVEAACDTEQATRLGALDLSALLADTVRACRALERGTIDASYAPLLDETGTPPASPGDANCVAATGRAAAKLARIASQTWQRTLDQIALGPLDADAKDAFAARAAARVRRAGRAVERVIASRCEPSRFARLYRQSSAQVLAAVTQAASCFAEDAYRQTAVTCPSADAAAVVAGTPCVGGSAGGNPCRNVDLLAHMPFTAIGGGQGNDVWGWTDTSTGREYALMGRTSGMSLVDVTVPDQPVYLGNLPTQTVNSTWRGIKVYADHAFVVSEASGHGMQVFDLRQLRGLSAGSRTFTPTTHYGDFGNCHTLAMNEETGFAYAAGTNSCSGGLHIVDVRDPTHPEFAGCVGSDGYTHETQCVVYRGADTTYVGREICFSSNTDTLTIIDVTNKSAPVQLSRTTYSGRGYTHQGWLTEDHRYFLMNDELDELNSAHNTRTRIWSVADLDAPSVLGWYDGPTTASDHNLYVARGHAFESNYRAGLRILDLAGVGSASLTEVAYFDMFPSSDAVGFAGTWTNYPFFASGTVLIAGIEGGLYIVRPQLAEGDPTSTPQATATVTATRTITQTRTPTATRTPAPPPSLDAIEAPIVVGTRVTLTGSGFTAGSRITGFLSTSQGAQAIGPFQPRAWTPTQLSWDVPASLPLGQGFAIFAIVNIDQGYVGSEYEQALLRGSAVLNRPTILGVNGGALNPPDGALPVVYVSTPIYPGAVATISGTGFNNAAVNFFTAAGNLGPLWPLAGATANELRVEIPASAPLGLTAFEVVNSPYAGAVGSQTVFVPIGDAPTLTGVTQSGATITVRGTGFAAGAAVNLFAASTGGGTANFGGPGLSVTVVAADELRFTLPAGVAPGAAYVQVITPPYIALTSTGSDPDGGFVIVMP